MRFAAVLGLLATISGTPGLGQTSAAPGSSGGAAPLPAIPALLAEAERNQHRLEALQRDYTYHVHTERQQLDKHGGLKSTEITDAESVAIDGVRVDRMVAQNGKPLTPDEQKKESERIDNEVAKARERRAKADAKGTDTDEAGHPVVSLARILELGTFSNERRIDLNGRPTIVLDYTGDPKAKTRTPFEAAFRCLKGIVWVDENERVLVRGEGTFVRDFKLGGGLIVDLHKDTTFSFQATRVHDAVWLPAMIDGQGSVRYLLLANFSGRLHVVTSDYKRFRASATILPGNGVIGLDGQILPPPQADKTQPTPTSTPTPPHEH